MRRSTPSPAGSLRFAATALALLLAAPAQADVVTFTGSAVLQTNSTAYSTPFNYDSANLFGTGLGTNLVGYTATFAFSFDTGALSLQSAFNQQSYIYASSAPISESVTIAGVTQTITGDYFSGLQFGVGTERQNGVVSHPTQLWVQAVDSHVVNGTADSASVSFYALQFADPSTGLPILPSSLPATMAYANFIFADGEQIVTPVDATLQGGGSGGGGSPGAVPEPATWALLLIGFGLAQAWLRRGRVSFSPRRI